MQEIYLHDVGGVEPDASDICTDELVCMLDGVNTTLGTKDDPRFGEYQEFLSSIDEASILKIEPDQISSGKYDGLDLTGDEESPESIVIKEPKETEFFPNSLAEFIKTACFVTLCTQGTVYEKGYTAIPDSAFVLPKYQTA
jgi:hypothetical protein